jgi:hypothetical protein
MFIAAVLGLLCFWLVPRPDGLLLSATCFLVVGGVGIAEIMQWRSRGPRD